jgi:IS5 family transposase
MRRTQLSFGDGLIAEEVSDLRDHWMEGADRVLADEEIVTAVYDALAQRHPKSRSRGRKGTPADVVLRLLISATSPAWAAARCPTPRPWAAGAWRWGRRRSNGFTPGWWQ